MSFLIVLKLLKMQTAPKSLRHFYGIITKDISNDLRTDLGIPRELSDDAYDRLVKGVNIPNTLFMVYYDLDGYYIILIKFVSSSIDFREKSISSVSDDTSVSTIGVPASSVKNSFRVLSEKYNLPTAAIHNMVLYSN